MAKNKTKLPKHVKIEKWLHEALTKNLQDGEELVDVLFRGRPSALGAPPGWIAVIRVTRLGKSMMQGLVWHEALQPSYADVQQMVSHMREKIDKEWDRSTVAVSKQEINKVSQIIKP